ncbi:hypothetical protein AB4144_60385, partial [Rhizobiaceae sp. 2RAB30]
MSLSALMFAATAPAETAASPLGQPTTVDPIQLVDPELRPILEQIPPLNLGMDNLQSVRSAQFAPALPAPAVQSTDRYIAGGEGNPRLRVVVL